MIIRPLSFVCGAFTTLFLFYLCILNYEIAQRYVVASSPIHAGQCQETPAEAGNLTRPAGVENITVGAGISNITTPDGVHNVTDATSSVAEAKVVSLESQITNATLGFEKILVVNLPERTDRRDSLTLTAALDGIRLDFIQAVHGDSVSPKAQPSHWRTGKHNSSSAELGNWRSHLTALRTIVENNYASALILEDDADWDVALKSQLKSYASITRTMSSASLNGSLVSSPYGPDWDILWLGTCATPPAPYGTRKFPNPHYEELMGTAYDTFESQHPFRYSRHDQTRLKENSRLRRLSSPSHYVFEAHEDIACLTAYAVTRQSARELMGFLLDMDEPTDLAVSRYCGRHQGNGHAQDEESEASENERLTNPDDMDTFDWPDDIDDLHNTTAELDDEQSPAQESSLPSPSTVDPPTELDKAPDSSAHFLRTHPRAFRQAEDSPSHPATDDSPAASKISPRSHQVNHEGTNIPAEADISPDDYDIDDLSIHPPEHLLKTFHNTPLLPRPTLDVGKRCLVVWPELFGQHRAAGSYARDSDTGNAGKEAGKRVVGETAKVVDSAVGRMKERFGRWGNGLEEMRDKSKEKNKKKEERIEDEEEKKEEKEEERIEEKEEREVEEKEGRREKKRKRRTKRRRKRRSKQNQSEHSGN